MSKQRVYVVRGDRAVFTVWTSEDKARSVCRGAGDRVEPAWVVDDAGEYPLERVIGSWFRQWIIADGAEVTR